MNTFDDWKFTLSKLYKYGEVPEDTPGVVTPSKIETVTTAVFVLLLGVQTNSVAVASIINSVGSLRISFFVSKHPLEEITLT